MTAPDRQAALADQFLSILQKLLPHKMAIDHANSFAAMAAEEWPKDEASEILRRLRHSGWRVAVHNDYGLRGKFHTFWGFTRGNLWVRGEGESDEYALRDAEQNADALVKHRREERKEQADVGG